MRGHRTVGHFQHHVLAGGAAFFPVLEGKAARVGNEIGVPYTTRIGFALAAEIFRIAVKAVGEIPRRVEHKVGMMKQVENDRHAVDRKEPGGLAAGAVEVLVPGVER